MTQQRAQYILRNMKYGSPRFTFGGLKGGGTLTYPDGITRAEDDYIRRAWRFLDGRSCYMSVIYAIAKGEKFCVTAEDKVECLLTGEIPWSKLGKVAV